MRGEVAMTLPVLSYLTQEDRVALLEKAVEQTFVHGETLLRAGDRGQRIYVIRKGAVRIETAPDGSRPAIAILEAGDFFGEMSLLESEPSSASVVAHGDVEVQLLPSSHVEWLMMTAPGFAVRFYKALAITLSHRLRETTQKTTLA